ncbi:lytic transglycosylase domain-containing protein [Arsenicibacter rosenii]|uniref:Lytic transglycosylase n=1 Tax=Arsenicibacter rosenii TaxID=1750698 RepID=A0A1S2VHT8_9BACT|nr:lytic transglycosylase domain-containing protein [Arsenicibacter rosenii]OIN57805.1 lytic transglycosylase [Arsenicibacter rosenii]
MKKMTHSLLKMCGVGCALGLVLTSTSGTAGVHPVAFVVQTDTTATDTLIVEEVVNLPTISPALIQERLPKLEKSIALPYHSAVQSYIDYFTFRKPSYTRTMLERRDVYFPMYEKMLAKYGLPDELKYLSIVESGLNPRAVSRVGAVGLWQFMPATGRDMSLYQDEFIDERMEPMKATEAACRYLKSLYRIFGDWHLALAAYNSGPGTVKRAMRRSGGNSFWTVYDHLPKETRSYVPQFIAFTYLMNYADDHGIVAEHPEYVIPHDTIHINNYVDLPRFAYYSGLQLEDIQKLNPQIVNTVLPAHTRQFPLRVPSGRHHYIIANRAAIMDSSAHTPGMMVNVLFADAEEQKQAADSVRLMRDTSPLLAESKLLASADASVSVFDNPDNQTDDIDEVIVRKPQKITHVVKRGEVLARIAERYGVDVYDVKQWNKLRSSQVKSGQRLIVYREAAETRLEQLADQGTEKAGKKAVPDKVRKPKYHTVQHGDTLWNIVQRYNGLTVEQLKKKNKIRGNSLRPGQRLIIG